MSFQPIGEASAGGCPTVCGECGAPLVHVGGWVSSRGVVYLHFQCPRCDCLIFQQGTGCTKADDQELITFLEGPSGA